MGLEVLLKSNTSYLTVEKDGEGQGIVSVEALCKNFQISQKENKPMKNPKPKNPSDFSWVSYELQNLLSALYCQYSQC